MTVAVGAGSRGLTDRVALLRGAISGLRDLGAEPFVVPAMGSHGGATAEGQRAMLETLGMTEDAIGAEIRATMETVEVARTLEGMPLYLDRHAAGADRILPVNRIKPHTCFKGPIESGCTKMAVVGFGKQPGAAQIHSCGPVEMRDRLLDGIAALRGTGRLLGGVASLESTQRRGRARRGADRRRGRWRRARRELTEYARGLVPALPFAEIDVLIIEQGGKDISGTTIDPNVTGRFWVHGLADLAAPDVVDHRAARHHRGVRRQRARHRLRRLHPGVGRPRHRLAEDLHQLLHRRARRRAPQPDADGAADRGRLHQGRAQHVRPRRRRAEAGRAHRQHPAPHEVLGQRRRCESAGDATHRLDAGRSRRLSCRTRTRGRAR